MIQIEATDSAQTEHPATQGAVVRLGVDGDRVRARVTGLVTSVVFRDQTNDWSVLTVQAGEKRIRVTGYSAAQEGQEIAAEGVLLNKESTSKWKNEITRELKAERIVATVPKSPKGVAAFLAANVRGVGPVLADRMARLMGDKLLLALDEETAPAGAPVSGAQNGADATPLQSLKSVKGVTDPILSGMKKAWGEHKAVADIMLFLHDQSISPAMCRRIHRCYGDKAREVLQDNPYRLAEDVRGIGFLKADEIAARLAVPRASPYRIQAAILHALEQASTQGHCGVRHGDLLEAVATMLAVPVAAVESQLGEMLAQPRTSVVDENGCIWLKTLYQAEKEIAGRMLRALKHTPSWVARLRKLERQESGVTQGIERACSAAKITLAQTQQRAVRMVLDSHLSIITGGPGCGKTTTLNIILDVLRRNRISFNLAAPTGNAADRAAQATGEPASTAHRLFKIGPDGPAVEIRPDVLIIDESSMIDVPLMRDILRGTSFDTSIVIVGDVDQLPSVGPGAVLSDLIESGQIPCTRLDVIYRQGRGSMIIENAHAVNRGEMPVHQHKDGDFFFINEKTDPRLEQAVNSARQNDDPGLVGIAAREILLDLVGRRLPKRYGFDPIKDMMVLSPMNNGRCGVKWLNPALQAQMNPREDDQTWKYGETRYGIGDKIMQTRNNYDLNVFNGNISTLSAINRDKKVLELDYSGRDVEHPFEDADELRLAYSMTIHKSQGSQAPCVVIPMLTEHFTMLQRNLLFTAITRAQKMCVLLGTTKSVSMAVRRTDSKKRLTRLRDYLSGNC